MITILENAVKHLSELKAKHNVKYIRLEVKGGGCAGYEYKWSFENEINEIDDLVIGDLVVDSMFAMYIAGMELDYKEEIFGSQFVFSNPNSKSSCGCGTSFSV